MNMKELRSLEVSENTDGRAGGDPRWVGRIWRGAGRC